MLRRCHSELRGESGCVNLADLERSTLFPVFKWTAGGWAAMKVTAVRYRSLDGGVRTPAGGCARPDRSCARTIGRGTGDSGENEDPIRRKTNARAAVLAGVNYFAFDPVVN